jgi:UDP-glucuronate 4-epimerase
MYAVTKRANELMAHSYSELYGVRSTGLRFFTVYGPWGRPDMALFIFTRAILEGKPIRVFNGGDMLRDFTYIDDIVEAVTTIVERGAHGGEKARLFNIGHGSPVKLMDYVHAVERSLGRKAQIEFAPMQQGDVQATYASTEKLRAEIGYAPSTSVETGVDRFVAWYRSHYSGDLVA